MMMMIIYLFCCLFIFLLVLILIYEDHLWFILNKSRPSGMFRAIFVLGAFCRSIFAILALMAAAFGSEKD